MRSAQSRLRRSYGRLANAPCRWNRFGCVRVSLESRVGRPGFRDRTFVRSRLRWRQGLTLYRGATSTDPMIPSKRRRSDKRPQF